MGSRVDVAANVDEESVEMTGCVLVAALLPGLCSSESYHMEKPSPVRLTEAVVLLHLLGASMQGRSAVGVYVQRKMHSIEGEQDVFATVAATAKAIVASSVVAIDCRLLSVVWSGLSMCYKVVRCRNSCDPLVLVVACCCLL
jgi:hypothetical protein